MLRNLHFFLLPVAVLLSGSTLAAAPADQAIERYAQMESMKLPRLSPDGTQIAFLAAIAGRYHVVIERFSPSFKRYILPPADDVTLKWVRWVNDERLVVSAEGTARRDLATLNPLMYTIDTEETRLYSISNTASDLVSIVRPGKFKETGSRVAKELPPPQIQDNVIDWLPHEPNHILVALDSDFDGNDEVRRVDVRNGKYDDEIRNYLGPFWVTDDRGEVRFGSGPSADRLSLRASYRGPDQDWVDVTTTDWFQRGTAPLDIDSSSDIALVAGSNEKGVKIVQRMNLATGEIFETVVQHDRVDVGGAVIDDSSGKVVGVWVNEHLPKPVYFDDTFNALQRTIDGALAGRVNVIVSTSRDHRQVLIRSTGESDGTSFFLWDREAKSLDFYAAQYGDLEEGHIAPTRAVEYSASDGLAIPAYLTVPVGSREEARPAVILPHGGPRSRADASYDYIVQFLASQGYVVLQPNFRGSAGYGAAFLNAGKQEWGGKMQTDVADGAGWLINEGIADPERISIVGWSYGGYVAAMATIQTPELYQCAVSINAVLDLPGQVARNVRYRNGRLMNESIGLGEESLRGISPYHNADKIDVPLLLVHARDDARTDYDVAKALADRLDDAAKPTRFIDIEFGGHTLENLDARKSVLAALHGFLSQYNN